MRGKRLWQTLRLYTMLQPEKRTEYLQKNCVFASPGKNCSIENRKVPLYAKLIKIGNNVRLASNVNFVTHDVSHFVLNHMNLGSREVPEKIGCIEIGNNVFVGADTMILYNVKIGSNVIIGARSLINRDIPDNCVAVGSPAKVVGTFDEFVKKRRQEKQYPFHLRPVNQQVSDELVNWCWKEFQCSRIGGK